MVVTVYFITLIASLTVLCMLLMRHKRTVSITTMFSILVVFNSLGRYLLSVSTTFEMARLGNLFVYVGACFCPLIVLIVLTRLCKMHMPKWVFAVLNIFSCVIFGLVLTIGHFPIYYKSVEIARGNGYSYLVKEYGPAHVLYPILMTIYFVLTTYCLFYAWKKRSEISMRTVRTIVVLALVIIISYIVERILGTRVSYVSIGYLLSTIWLIHLIERINMYDLPTNIAASIEAMNQNAYIEFDNEYCLAGYNDRVKQLFPEVENKWYIDKEIEADDSYLYQEVISWVFHRKPEEKKTILIDGMYYEMNVREIPYMKKKCVGYMLELVDRTAEHMYMETIKRYNTDLEAEVEEKTEHISYMRDMMVLGMATMVESRDNSTGGHIKRTTAVMRIFSRHLLKYCDEIGVSKKFLKSVTRAAAMHDLGKIAVDDAVLRKKGKFDDEEFEAMKKHSKEGARIVRGMLEGVEDDEFIGIAENIAHYHHEKWNGQGYPEGLKGTEIPIEARLMALADVFDALVSERCYKDAFSYEESFAIIEESLGSHFDPQLGKLFIECRDELEAFYDQAKG